MGKNRFRSSIPRDHGYHPYPAGHPDGVLYLQTVSGYAGGLTPLLTARAGP